MATFCTLFQCDNSHITKDVGLIPYGMYEFCGYDSFITAYPEEDLPNLKDTPGMRVERVPKLTGDWLKDSCEWLRENAKKIDVLNLYHLCKDSVKQYFTYKKYNPNGKVYLKFDGIRLPKRIMIWMNIKPRLMIHECTLISTELQEDADILTREWDKKTLCIPNPLNPNEIHEYKSFSERSNIILTVGRLGVKKKATDILLDAFIRIADRIPNWKLKLVGQIKKMKIKDKFFAKYPEMKERVIFTGEIKERELIAETYRDAKIFAFPSRGESWGIALAEAMMNGCFAVASRIPSSITLTENFRFALGHDVDDVDSLADNLLYACTHEHEIESLAIEGREATLKRCDLKSVCEVIAEGLNNGRRILATSVVS